MNCHISCHIMQLSLRGSRNVSDFSASPNVQQRVKTPDQTAKTESNLDQRHLLRPLCCFSAPAPKPSHKEVTGSPLVPSDREMGPFERFHATNLGVTLHQKSCMEVSHQAKSGDASSPEPSRNKINVWYLHPSSWCFISPKMGCSW